MSFIFPVILIGALIAMNALYVAAEFSAVAARPTRLKALADQKKPGAAWMYGVSGDTELLDRYVAAAQLGITISSLALGYYGQNVLSPLLEPLAASLGAGAEAAQSASLAVVLVVLTVFQVIFGELLPKSIGLGAPETLALVTSAPMRLSMKLYSPLIAIFNGSANFVLSLWSVEHGGERNQARTADEIRMLVGESRSGGVLDEVEYRLLDNALRLREFRAGQVMIPRGRVQGLEASTPLKEALAVLADSPHSRAPVYTGSLDTPIGLVHIKELMEAARSDQELGLADIVRPLPVVPETISVRQLFKRLQRDHFHMAIVADEYGGVSGIVTLEDLIERIFGDVSDEFDPASSNRLTRQDDRVRLSGQILLVDFNDWFGSSLAANDTNTLAGLLTEICPDLPDPEDEIEADGLKFRVEETNGRVITFVSLPLNVEMEKRLEAEGLL